MKCPVASLESTVSVPALTKLHHYISTTSDLVVLNSTTVVMWVIPNCMFSLTTLPVHCCSTVFTDLTSLTSRTLVTLLVKRTYISEYYCWYVSLQCYETERYRGCVKSCTYRSVTTHCTGKIIRQTIGNYLHTTVCCI